MKMTSLDRILLLLTGLLASYQVVVGINGLGTVPITAYTIAFGVIVVAGLLLIILGFEVLDSPIVVIISTIIPLSLALGLVWQYIEAWRMVYLWFSVAAFAAVLVTRTLPMTGKLPMAVIAISHGVSGMIIFLLPTILAAQAVTRPGFGLVGLGGALIGINGLLLSFLKAGKPILPRETILRIFAPLLLLTSAAFVAGFLLA